MNEPETNTPVPDELAGQVASLQRQVIHAAAGAHRRQRHADGVFVLPIHTLGKDLDSIKPQATPDHPDLQTKAAAHQNFVQELVAYGQAHPDFQPILKKYGIVR